MCFIDYTKSFERTRHDEIITQLTQIYMGKNLRVIKKPVLGTNSGNKSGKENQLVSLLKKKS